MNNVYELPDSNTSYDEASAWIAKMDKGLSEKEQDEFRDWLDASTDNHAVFMKMARLWDKMDALAKLAEICPPTVAVAPRHRMRFALPAGSRCSYRARGDFAYDLECRAV